MDKVKQPLVALKSFRYATRRLQPGDSFEAGERDARLLLRMKRAEVDQKREKAVLPVIPPALVTAVQSLSSPAAVDQILDKPPADLTADPVKAPDPTVAPLAPVVAPSLEELRDKYKNATQKYADGRWSVTRLMEELKKLGL